MVKRSVMFKYIFYFSITVITQVKCCTVMTTNGLVAGNLVNDGGVTYCSYQGIPYAEEPTRALRFLPPVPKAPWTGILDATKQGYVCPQATSSYARRDQMSEDCLNINLYVPANMAGLLPVLAFVHGGEFKTRSGNTDLYGPQMLLQRNIIVVTMNYRLGALGFLSLGTKEASGNAGIKDVLLALKWIKSNVERFGGDPNQVTLGGNSAGAVLVHILLLTEKSKGLFQQVIMTSGSILGYRFLARHPKEITELLAKQLDLLFNDTQTLTDHLKSIDALTIIEAQADMGNDDKRGGFRPFAPFVPLLVGFNSQEGIKMLPVINKNQRLVEYLNENFELCIPTNIEYPYGSNRSIALANAIHDRYFKNNSISNTTLQNFVELITDTQFSYAINSWIEMYNKKKDSNRLYYYVFNFDGELNYNKVNSNISFPGTAHGDELGYIFVTDATKPLLNKLGERTRKTLDYMLTFLTNFIKFREPAPEDYPGTNWPAADSNSGHLLLNDCPEFISHGPLLDRMDFWQELYEDYRIYVENYGELQIKVIP